MHLARILLLLVALLALLHPPAVHAEDGVALQVVLDNQSINPITARFVARAIERAEEQNARCLVIVLDTPGGLLDSTRTIVSRILRSDVPVIVYVAPSGARAASAGVFITMSAHVAAMAPGTHIGAARPVQPGGLPGATRPDDDGTTPMQEKVLRDTVAWARSLAELRGRNADWAASTVEETVSVPSSAALREGAIDLLADDVPGLLREIDGREVELRDRTETLRTAGVTIEPIEMWWGERLLTTLANPNVAFLLLILGFYGILFELYTPGWGVSGTLGIVALLLGFLAMAVLPINYVGLALIGVALALFVAEAFIPSYGALTAAGVGCLVLGGLMLVDSPAGFERVSLVVVLPVAAATALITVFLLSSIVRAHRGVVQTGTEATMHAEATSLDEFQLQRDRYTGMVRMHGEMWRAVSSQPIALGERLKVVGRDGLTLEVEPVPAVPPARSSDPSGGPAAPDRSKKGPTYSAPGGQ